MQDHEWGIRMPTKSQDMVRLDSDTGVCVALFRFYHTSSFFWNYNLPGGRFDFIFYSKYSTNLVSQFFGQKDICAR